MEKPMNTLSDRVCWVALAVAMVTLALLLWMFD